jgi:hypothetical protein
MMRPFQSANSIVNAKAIPAVVDAPPISPVKTTAPISRSAEQRVSPELTPVYEAFLAANDAISATPNGDLRSALATAALGVIVKEAQRAIGNLNSSNDPVPCR